MEVVAAHDGADSGREDEPQVAPEPPAAKPLLVLAKAVPFEGLDGDGKQLPYWGGLLASLGLRLISMPRAVRTIRRAFTSGTCERELSRGWHSSISLPLFCAGLGIAPSL